MRPIRDPPPGRGGPARAHPQRAGEDRRRPDPRSRCGGREGARRVLAGHHRDGRGVDTARPYEVVRNGATVTPYNLATGSGTITQPVVNVPAWPLYRQAQRLLDAQKASSTDAKRVLEFNAAQAFFNSLAAQAVLAAAGRRRDTAKSSLDDAQARVQAQLNSSNDVTRAQLDLASAVQEVASDDGNRATARTSQLELRPQHEGPGTARPAGDDAPGGGDEPVGRRSTRSSRPRREPAARPRSPRSTQRIAAHFFADEPLLRHRTSTLGVTAGINGSTLVMGSGYLHFDETLGLATLDLADLRRQQSLRRQALSGRRCEGQRSDRGDAHPPDRDRRTDRGDAAREHAGAVQGGVGRGGGGAQERRGDGDALPARTGDCAGAHRRERLSLRSGGRAYSGAAVR